MKSRHQRPEGAAIERALKRSPKKSMRALAEEVGLSEGRIRQIINGYRTEGGQVLTIVGPVDTLARMAEAAGATAEEMRQAGREDVAEEMTVLKSVGVTEDGGLWLSDHSEEVELLREWLDAGDDNTPPPTKALLLWDFEQLMEAAQAKHRDELRLKDYFIEFFGKRQTSNPFVPDPYFPAGGDERGDAAPTTAGREDDLRVDLAAYPEDED